MLRKIKRETALASYPVFPITNYDTVSDDYNYHYPKIFEGYLLTLESGTFRGHLTELGRGLVALTNSLGCESFLFLVDNPTAWLYQVNDYPPVTAAREYLLSHKTGKRFNRAFEVDRMELPVFIKHLGWLTRCNARLPYIHFIDPEQTVVGHICKYGVLHLDALNASIANKIETFVDESNFHYGDREDCYNRFGKTSAIAGRESMR